MFPKDKGPRQKVSELRAARRYSRGWQVSCETPWQIWEKGLIEPACMHSSTARMFRLMEQKLLIVPIVCILAEPSSTNLTLPCHVLLFVLMYLVDFLPCVNGTVPLRPHVADNLEIQNLDPAKPHGT